MKHEVRSILPDDSVTPTPTPTPTPIRPSWVDRFCVCVLVTILVIVSAAVVFRYGLNRSLSWSDEAIRYLFVWFTLVGAVAVARRDEHLRVTYFLDCVGGRMRRWMHAIAVGSSVALLLLLCVAGVLWTVQIRFAVTPAMAAPIALVQYAAVPFSAVLWGWAIVRATSRRSRL